MYTANDVKAEMRRFAHHKQHNEEEEWRKRDWSDDDRSDGQLATKSVWLNKEFVPRKMARKCVHSHALKLGPEDQR